MTQEEFHKHYEEESARAFNELNQLTEEEILKIIADKNEKKYGIWKGRDNYQIWYALQSKGTERSIKPLFEIVSNLKNDYLIRYHACFALFKIANITDTNFRGEVQYGRNSELKFVNQQNAINKLGEILNLEVIRSVTEKKTWWKFWNT
jgi:hypothetical protein